MNILILSTSNPYKTAGVVALDIYKGLKNINGNQVKILVKSWDKFPDKNISSVENFFVYLKNKVARKCKKLLIRYKLIKLDIPETNPDYHVQDYNQTISLYSTKKIIKRTGFKPDVIIVFFMQSFLSFKNLFEINKSTNAPIFLCLMDMAPMTGGCHYAWECKGYYDKCGNCPALYSENENDQSRKNWEFKKEYIARTNLTVIAGTEHQYKQLQKSSLFSEKLKVKILIGIDPNIFKPGNMTRAKNDLGLPINKKVIFFGAGNVASTRKGYKELSVALSLLKEKYKSLSDIHLVVAGNGTDELKSDMQFNYTLLGHINHITLAKAFQSADIFLCPSIEDSGPMMINQSIMCGTPVVSFEMGVALDLIITGETGYRANLGDAEDLARGIQYILKLDKPEYMKLSENCRAIGLKLFHPQIIVARFMELFETKTRNENSLS